MSFLNSIKNNSKEHSFPFNHWEYSDALSEGAIDEIVKAHKYVDSGRKRGNVIIDLLK